MATVTNLPIVLLRANYNAMVRYPLTLIDDVVVSRLDDGAAVRLAYQDLVAKIEETAGRVLREEIAEQRARVLRARTEEVRSSLAASRRQLQYRMAVEGQRRLDRYRQFRRRERAYRERYFE